MVVFIEILEFTVVLQSVFVNGAVHTLQCVFRHQTVRSLVFFPWQVIASIGFIRDAIQVAKLSNDLHDSIELISFLYPTLNYLYCSELVKIKEEGSFIESSYFETPLERYR